MDRANDVRLPGLGALLGLLVLVLLVFQGALRAGFVNFDDNLFFGPDNPEFRDQGLAAILDPRRTIANVYLPVSHLSLYADWWLAGAAPLWPHLHSLLLQALAAFLVARLLARLGAAAPAAILAAAVFAVHPALVESVAWVSSRKDLLCGVFVLLACGQFAQLGQGRLLLRASLIAACALAALYSKATAVVLPLFLLGIAALRPAAPDQRLVRRLAVGGVTLLCVLAGWHHHAVAAAEGTLQAGPLGPRLAQVPGAFWHYFHTLFWPVAPNVLYPEVQTLERFRAHLVPAGLACGLLLTAALGLVLRPQERRSGVCALLVFAALVPFNTAWPASPIAAADRYLYLAVPWAVGGLALLAGPLRIPGLLLLAVLLPGAGWQAHQRTQDFASSEALWRASLACDPANAVACLNLAQALDQSGAPRDDVRALLEQAAAAARYPIHRLRACAALRDLAHLRGQHEEAARHAERAVEAAGDLPASFAARALHVDALLQATIVARAAGNQALAGSSFAAAKALAPEHPGVLAQEAAQLLGQALDAQGRARADDPRVLAAQGALGRAFAAAPDHFETNLTQGHLHQALGEYVRAHGRFARAAQIAPQRSESYLGQADLALAQGLYPAAEQAVRSAIANGASDPRLYARLGFAFAGQGRLAEARDYYEAYLTTNPGDPNVRKNLAAVLLSVTLPRLFQLRADQLEPVARRVAELDPDNPKGHLLQGVIARAHKDFQLAIRRFDLALQAMPGDPEVIRLLGESHRDRGYQLLLTGSERDPAHDHLRRFLDLAPPGQELGAAKQVLEEECKRREERATRLLATGETAAGEIELRRSLQLLPGRGSSSYLLGLALAQRQPPDWTAALPHFVNAEASQRQAGLDPGLPVLYQVIALRELGQLDAARQKVERTVGEPAGIAADVLTRIRQAVPR